MSAMRFIFDGADGDQSYFGERFIAERVFESWFSGKLARGEAYLVQVLTGAHKGEYLALTSRVDASLEDQLTVRDYISVVVQAIHNHGPAFVEDEVNMPPIGMAAVQVITPKKPLISSDPW